MVRLIYKRHLIFIVGEDGGGKEAETKPTEELVVVLTNIPVSSTPFGEIQLKLPVKEDESKEEPKGKPALDEVQVLNYLEYTCYFNVVYPEVYILACITLKT